MGILSNIFSGGASKLVESVTNGLDNLITNKEELAAAKLAVDTEVNRHIEALEANATKELELQLKDVADARNANARIQESDKASFWAKNTAYFLDVFIGLIWGSITMFLVAKALHLAESVQADMTAVLSIYSTVTAIFMTCVNFHRSSSVGSQNKQKIIDNMMNK